MNHKEDENDRSENAHVSWTPGTAFTHFWVSYSAGFFVCSGQNNWDSHMEKNKEEVSDGNGLNQWIAAHKFSIKVESFAWRISDELKVSN